MTVTALRYGGLGDHRTPTGFSGDTVRKWDTLEYEVYMTSRASNVGFGWRFLCTCGFRGQGLSYPGTRAVLAMVAIWGAKPDP